MINYNSHDEKQSSSLRIQCLHIKVHIYTYKKKVVSSTGGGGAKWAYLAHGLNAVLLLIWRILM